MNEIIIDGVNVSECPNFKVGICSKRLCELSVNEKCNYKQLQRAKAENEQLKQTLQEIKKECHWVSECGVTNDNMWGYDNILDLIAKAEKENE